MSYILKKYYLYICIITSLIIAEDLVYEYTINEGANLISFPIISDNYDINYFFSSDNENLLSNLPIDNHIISLISEGELTFKHNDQWIGSLNEIDNKKGYWLIADQEIAFLLTATNHTENIYYLHPGGNLISYPFTQNQPYYEAIPFLSNNLLAVLGENEALYNNNGILIGSLNTFEPGKGYWFIVDDYTPFQYSEPSLNSTPNHNSEQISRDDEILEFNQSTLQSAFFIESIYLSGNQNTDTLELNIQCNGNIVGQSSWEQEYSDLIAMGNDGFEHTIDYCMNNQEVVIQNAINNQNLYNLFGNTIWRSNNFEILVLSDCNFGDLNFNQMINISDIVLMIEHITGLSQFNNNHQLLLADINKDNFINVADVIIIINQILDY